MRKLTVDIPDEDHALLKKVGDHGIIARIVRASVRYYVLGENGSGLLTSEVKEEIDRIRREILIKHEKERTKEEILFEGFERVKEAFAPAIARKGINWLMADQIDIMREHIFQKYHIVYPDREMRDSLRENYKKIESEIEEKRTAIYEIRQEMKRDGLIE